MVKEKLISEIVKLELEITRSVINEGHMPHDDDKFKLHRYRLKKLRCQLFGKSSEYCKPRKF